MRSSTRPRLAGARGDELRFIDTADDQVIVGPGLVYPLSIPTETEPILLASAPYEEIGVDYRRAVEKSKFLSCFAAETIRAAVPAVHRCMIRKTCVLNWETRALEEIETVCP